MRFGPLSLLILILGSTPGCNVCSGLSPEPGCEDTQWPRTRVAIHWGGRWEATRDPWGAEGTTLIDGLPDDGPDWSIEAIGPDLLLGRPDTQDVVAVSTNIGRVEEDQVPVFDGYGRFGHAVSYAPLAGHTAVWVTDPDHALRAGAAYLFFGDLSTTATRSHLDADLTVVGPDAGAQLGHQVVRCGDLTGDGEPEWLITAPGMDRDEASIVGGVVLARSETLTPGRRETLRMEDLGPTWWGSEAGEGLGTSATCRDDVTGDGVPDIVLGAPWWGPERQGAVYVLSGAALPPTGALSEGVAAFIPAVDTGLKPGEHWLGMAVATGDADGTPPAELALGAPGSSGGSGQVLLLERFEDGFRRRAWFRPDDVADLELTGADGTLEPVVSFHEGHTLAMGDLDADQRADLFLATPDWTDDTARPGKGRIAVWRGRDSNTWDREAIPSDARHVIAGDASFQRVGRRILVADLDGDGFDELILTTRRRVLAQ